MISHVLPDENIDNDDFEDPGCSEDESSSESETDEDEDEEIEEVPTEPSKDRIGFMVRGGEKNVDAACQALVQIVEGSCEGRGGPSSSSSFPRRRRGGAVEVARRIPRGPGGARATGGAARRTARTRTRLQSGGEKEKKSGRVARAARAARAARRGGGGGEAGARPSPSRWLILGSLRRRQRGPDRLHLQKARAGGFVPLPVRGWRASLQYRRTPHASQTNLPRLPQTSQTRRFRGAVAGAEGAGAGGSTTDAAWRVENCALARAQLATASRFVSPQSRHDIAKIYSWVPLSSMSCFAWSKHTITRHSGHTMKGPRAPTVTRNRRIEHWGTRDRRGTDSPVVRSDRSGSRRTAGSVTRRPLNRVFPSRSRGPLSSLFPTLPWAGRWHIFSTALPPRAPCAAGAQQLLNGGLAWGLVRLLGRGRAVAAAASFFFRSGRFRDFLPIAIWLPKVALWTRAAHLTSLANGSAVAVIYGGRCVDSVWQL